MKYNKKLKTEKHLIYQSEHYEIAASRKVHHHGPAFKV